MKQHLTAVVAVAVIAVSGVMMVIPASEAKLPVLSTKPSRAFVLEKKVAWLRDRADRLERRNGYLHRYIDQMRRTTVPKPSPTPRATPAAPSSATSSAPAPSSSGGCLSDGQIASYARAAGFPESVISTMVYIAAHRNGTGESGGCPGAINPSSGACGLWQIYPAQPGCTDPATNAALAYEKYKASGLSPWGG